MFYWRWTSTKKENKRSLCLRCAQDVQIEREKQIYNVTGGCTALAVVYLQGKLYVANAGDSRCRNRAMKTSLPVCFVAQGTQFFFPCVCRAIIIRNNDIIPMSTEFTPESERQRLQFLVKNEYEKGRHQPDLRKSADKRRVLQGPYRLSQGLSFSAAQSGNWIKQSAKDKKLRL